MLAEEPPDRCEPTRAIVDLDDALPDERPVLGCNAAPHLQLLAFDIDIDFEEYGEHHEESNTRNGYRERVRDG